MMTLPHHDTKNDDIFDKAVYITMAVLYNPIVVLILFCLFDPSAMWHIGEEINQLECHILNLLGSSLLRRSMSPEVSVADSMVYVMGTIGGLVVFNLIWYAARELSFQVYRLGRKLLHYTIHMNDSPFSN